MSLAAFLFAPVRKPRPWAYAAAAFLSQEGAANASEMGEDSSPFVAELTYTGEVWTLASGEGGRDARYLDNFDVVVNADLEALLGLRDTTMSVYGLYNNGTPFSEDIVGDAMVVSNIEAPVDAFRLYEAWIERRFGGGAWSARFGLYDLNSEFDALEASSFFIGSAHGIGADISQSGEAGPSIFPITSLALRLEYSLTEHLKIRTAILDGVPGDPDEPARTVVNLSKTDGALIITEADATFGPVRAIGGYWRYTSPFARHDGIGEQDSDGAYVRGEALLFERADGAGALAGFVRAGWADGGVNQFSSFYSAGLVYDGLLSDAGADQAGIAIVYAGVSQQYRAANLGAAEFEAVIEASYRTPVFEWLSLQPNLQYIINPGLDPARRDAVAVGLRFEIGYASAF